MLAAALMAPAAEAVAGQGPAFGTPAADALDLASVPRIATLIRQAHGSAPVAFGVEGDCFASAPARARDAIVYLVIPTGSSRASAGSGAIVAGSGGRVLTAAHVASLDGHRRVDAYDRTGRWLAALEPATSGRSRAAKGDAEEVAQDVSVLRPVAFADERARRDWMSRGLEISRTQSPSLQMVVMEPGSMVLNHGASGAPVLDAAGRITGVLSRATTGRQNETIREEAHGFLDAVTATGSEARRPGMKVLKAEAAARMRGRGLKGARDAVAVAAPVTQKEVLAVLGVDPSSIRLAQPEAGKHTRILAYPDHVCRQGGGWTYPLAANPSARSVDVRPVALDAGADGPGF
ncbi:hypothetical protein LAZ40_03270 [Cereibacter sphaeroides]|uniref:hypothetical protein n=1 Tax=Cereibacter sphaeroides TaxID=1063 RepID=UPI001F2E22CF|nr:hypothetical protein [Cereibacter sphaeroides]MCE6958076.1 hypothetical protein [Cereibacter sphaeroides]MCE6971313.1 hypothetical protein [Cereibacter sphaeroides]